VVSNEDIAGIGIKAVDLEVGFKNARCVIIMNNHKKYRELDIIKLLKTASKPCLFVDCWRVFDKKMFEKIDDIEYTGVGIV